LSQDPRIEWAQPLQQFQSLNTEVNSLYRAQPSAAVWHIRELHGITTGLHVNITVIDSGVDDQHPDLAGQITHKENFVDGDPYKPELHGTAVAGIIAAKAGNSNGFEGIAPGAHITALRACWQENADTTRCNSFTLGKALNFALMHDTGIINLSLSGPPDRLVQALVQAALARGMTVVAAIDPQKPELSFPASIPGVLAVGSDATPGLPSKVVLAPARDIPAPSPHSAYRFVSGTSFAAAHVSGIVALLLELRPSLSPAQIHDMLTRADTQFAHGIDACVTIARIAGLCACSCSANNAANAFEHQ
jgi:subtilisin family serine protease